MKVVATGLSICVLVMLSGVSLAKERSTEDQAVAVQGAFLAVFDAFKTKSYKKLSRWAHEKDGLTIYHSINGTAVTFKRRQLRKLASDDTAHRFGMAAGSGLPIEITGHDFFFGDRADVPSSVGPLPDWKRIFRYRSRFAINNPISTAFEPSDAVPAAFKGLTYWSIRYPGTKKNEHHDASEVRLFFKKASRIRSRLQARRAPISGYRLVGLVMAATYSP